MSSPSWPAGGGFPTAFQIASLNDTPYKPVVQTTMQTGPKKIRQEDDVTFKTWTGTIILNPTTLATFEDWVRNTINFGATPFVWKDPVTQASTTYRLLSWGPRTVITPALFQMPLTIEEVP